MAAGRRGNRNGHNIGILAALLQGVAHDNILELRTVLLDIGNAAVNGGLAPSLNFQRIQRRPERRKGFNGNVVDKTGADYAQHLGIRLGQQLYANARNGSGTIGTDQVCGHERLRCAGFLVIQNDHQNGTGQTLFPVFHVRAVPLHTCHIELAAQICRHCHKAAVRTILRHVRECGIIRKTDHTAVRVAVFTAHAVISVVQKLHHFFHGVGALHNIIYTSVQHVLFTQIQNVNFRITHNDTLLLIGLGTNRSNLYTDISPVRITLKVYCQIVIAGF